MLKAKGAETQAATVIDLWLCELEALGIECCATDFDDSKLLNII